MNDSEKLYFEMISSKGEPCCFFDLETLELLYLNQAMGDFLGYENYDYDGIKCHELFHNDSLLYITHPSKIDEMEKGECLNFEFLCGITETYVKTRIMLLTYNGKKMLYYKFYETDLDLKLSRQEIFMQSVTKCLDILHIVDAKQRTYEFLKVLGEEYNCDRAFLYHCNNASEVAECVSSWKKDDTIQELSFQDIQEEIDSFYQQMMSAYHLGIIETDKNDTLGNVDENTEEVSKYDLKNITICPAKKADGELISFLGISNRDDQSPDYRLLKMISQFLQEPSSDDKIQEVINTNLQDINNSADIDKLTGMFTRDKFTELCKTITNGQLADLGIILVNGNGIKKINHDYGIDKGDEQLKHIANMLREFLPFEWYRFSADEFICFVFDCSEQELKSKIDSVQRELSKENNRLFAVGYAWTAINPNVTDLIEHAETMMYIDKQTYYNEAYYNDRADERQKFNDYVLDDLLHALRNNEFLIFLQPKVHLKTEEVIGAEALIRRFDKKNNKMIFPDQFISLYEQRSIIRHVDFYVLHQVCSLLEIWNKMGKALKVSVNLSRVTLLEHDIVQKFVNICKYYDVNPRQIVVEVTERVGLIENDVNSPLIEEFKEQGFTISLDDFGCAYSNIVTLAKVSVDEVKIDKSLVDDILTNEKNYKIVKSLIEVINSFPNTSTIAEGIETQAQADYLKTFNCMHGQGYLYSRPIATDEFFEKYIANS